MTLAANSPGSQSKLARQVRRRTSVTRRRSSIKEMQPSPPPVAGILSLIGRGGKSKESVRQRRNLEMLMYERRRCFIGAQNAAFPDRRALFKPREAVLSLLFASNARLHIDHRRLHSGERSHQVNVSSPLFAVWLIMESRPRRLRVRNGPASLPRLIPRSD